MGDGRREVRKRRLPGSVSVRSARAADLAEWRSLRGRLWPRISDSEHRAEMEIFRSRPRRFIALVALDPSGRVAGFVEVSIRRYEDTYDPRPIGYLEGWYVRPSSRRLGIGTSLVAAAESWARDRGARAMGSDSHAHNRLGRAAHRALGFRETESIVRFRKDRIGATVPPRRRG